MQENQSLINPILGKCNNYKCQREIYLRKGTIFEFYSKTTAQVLHTIIKLWLNDEMNVTKIANKLTDIFLPDKIDRRFIYTFITKCRLAIANYNRQIYQLDCIAPKDSHYHIAVDESLFTHIDGVQHWLIGLLNTKVNDLRIEVLTDRSQKTLKTIIENHIGTRNYIVSYS